MCCVRDVHTVSVIKKLKYRTRQFGCGTFEVSLKYARDSLKIRREVRYATVRLRFGCGAVRYYM